MECHSPRFLSEHHILRTLQSIKWGVSRQFHLFGGDLPSGCKMFNIGNEIMGGVRPIPCVELLAATLYIQGGPCGLNAFVDIETRVALF